MLNYIRPSDCELCVPIETRSDSGAMGGDTISRAHEPECPNNPTLPLRGQTTTQDGNPTGATT